MIEKYDICILCLNYIKNDARSLNLANTLVSLKKKVAVICLQDNSESEFDFDVYKVNIDPDVRLYKKMMIFTSSVRLDFSYIKSDYYVASELYSLPAASLIRAMHNGLLIYDSREIFSAIGNTHNKPFKQFFFKKLEQFFVRSVSSIIVSGKLDADYLRTIFPQYLHYYVIMNVPFFKVKINQNLLRQHFSIDPKKKIILYQGMIMQGRGIETAIRAMQYLEEYALVIMGDGEDMIKHYKKIANDLELSNRVYFKSFVPYNDLHNWTCSADVGLALFEPLSLSYLLALPNKLFEYAMAGIPSISTNLPAIADIVKDNPISHLVDYPFDLNKIVESIKFVTEPINYHKYQESALISSKKFNYENQTNEIKRVFNIL